MKRTYVDWILIVTLYVLLFAAATFPLWPAIAFSDEIKAGATDQTVVLKFIDGSGDAVTGLAAAGISCYYWRALAASATAISDSDHTNLNDAHTDGGVKEIDATNAAGLYRFDIPDAMVADGVDWVTLSCTGTGAKPYQEKIELPDNVVQDVFAIDDTAAAGAATTITLGSSALAVEDAYNNRAMVIIKSGTGSGQARCITDYTAGRVATVSAWDTTPDGTSGYVLEAMSCGVQDANLVQIDGAATNGNNATLNLKQLNVVNSAGDAIIASSTGSNGDGISASGNGSGHGVMYTGGATGNGFYAIGGATSGDGMLAEGDNGIDFSLDGTSITAGLGCAAWDCVRTSHVTAGTFGEGVPAAAVRE